MADLPTVGRQEMSGEKTSDEASELLPLAEIELVPEGRAAGERAGSLPGRGGTGPGLGLRMASLLVVDGAAGTTGTVPAVPQRRL